MNSIGRLDVRPSRIAASADRRRQYLDRGNLELSRTVDPVQDEQVTNEPIDRRIPPPLNKTRSAAKPFIAKVNEPSKRQRKERQPADTIVDGNYYDGKGPHPSLSPSTKKRRAAIVSRLALEFNTYKQSLGEGRSEHYGADNRFHQKHKLFYGDWLTLGAIKGAARRQRAKAKKQAEANSVPAAASSIIIAVSVSSVPRQSSDNTVSDKDNRNSPLFQLQPLAPRFQAPVEPSPPFMGSRHVGSTNDAYLDLEKRKILDDNHIAQKFKETRDA